MPLVIIFEDLYTASKVNIAVLKVYFFVKILIFNICNVSNSIVLWILEPKKYTQVFKRTKIEKLNARAKAKIAKQDFCLVLSTQMVLLWANTLSSLCVQISLQHLLSLPSFTEEVTENQVVDGFSRICGGLMGCKA